MIPTNRNWGLLIGALALLTASTSLARQTEVFPASDPSNEGTWRLNNDVSDEFDGAKLDTSKWLVQGTDGVYKSNFIGRAPSQFSTGNVRIENGKLKLETKWDPDFEFSDKLDFTWKEKKDGMARENITTAAVISKKQFRYGYMEIKAKAADASVSSSFWMTGKGTELDVFEHLGRPSLPNKKQLETEIWSSIHDWNSGGKSTWTDRLQLGFRVADDFHVYGVEWDENYLKFYVDKKLIRTVTREQVGEKGWVITEPQWVWVDSETFPWHGIPDKKDLPVDYEIEYVRIWQKDPTTRKDNLIDSQFFSFEDSITVDDKVVSWWIPEDARKHFSVVDDKASSGSKSLKFSHSASLPNDVVAFAPFGSVTTGAGEFEFSMKVWLEPESSLQKVRVIFQDPWLELKPFDLTQIDAGKWVTLTQRISRKAASGEKDRPRILIQKDDTSGKPSTLYIDELSIKKN